MKIEEFDCGSWGWYFEDDGKLMSNPKEFLENLILFSCKYGINLSAFGLNESTPCDNNLQTLTDQIYQQVKIAKGNQLQKAIHLNFYSQEDSTRILPSVIYANDPFESNLYKDMDSILFSTLKDEKFYSIFYNMRSNVFIQANDHIFWNTARFNSYIRCMHQLMNEFKCSSFDFSNAGLPADFDISLEGYILHKQDCIFYEDIYDILPTNRRYVQFEEIALPSWYSQ